MSRAKKINFSQAIIGGMSTRILHRVLSISLLLAACSPSAVATPTVTMTPVDIATMTRSATKPPTETPLPTLTRTPLPTETATQTPAAVVESLEATVIVNLLSCRYGPGPEYLYLYALNEGARITLIGQTGGNNWVWVDGMNKCWVNIKYLNIDGDFKTLPVVYPDHPAKLPRVAYYDPTTVLSTTRNGNEVTVLWLAIPVSPGDYEKPDMFIYIIEVWRCEGGQLIFDPLTSNRETISFIDEPGCTQPSHGRVLVQDKHGYTRPAEIPWP